MNRLLVSPTIRIKRRGLIVPSCYHQQRQYPVVDLNIFDASSPRRTPIRLNHRHQIRSSWSGAIAAAATAAVTALSGKSFLSPPLAATALVVSVTAFIVMDSTVGIRKTHGGSPPPPSKNNNGQVHENDANLTKSNQTNNANSPNPITKSSSPSSSSSSIDRSSPSSSAYWKNGLLYDDPNDDPPTHCSFCKVYRQGPCRSYWRPFELCMAATKRQRQQQAQDGTPTPATTMSSTLSPTISLETCTDISERFRDECLFYHVSLYELIRLQTLQDTYVDVGERMQRQHTNDIYWDHPPCRSTTNETATQPRTEDETQHLTHHVIDLLLDDDIYQHVQDCMEWCQTLHIDWSYWVQLVQTLGWSKAEVMRRMYAEEEWLQSRRQHKPSSHEKELPMMRPTWWSTTPPLLKDGMDQIVDYLDARSRTITTTTNATKEQSVPWPLRPKSLATSLDRGNDSHDDDDDDDDESILNPQIKDSQAYWQHLQDQPDPVLLELQVKVPNFLPVRNNEQTARRLQHAYARDAKTGRLLGYVAESKQQEHNKKDRDGDKNNQGETNQDATSILPNHHKENYASLFLQILPGRTGLIQIYGCYEDVITDVDDDDNATAPTLLVSPPIRLVDVAFGRDDSYDAQRAQPPSQALHIKDISDGQQRFEKYQILRNFVKFQQQSQQQHDSDNGRPAA